jgi:hypothetical protein
MGRKEKDLDMNLTAWQHDHALHLPENFAPQDAAFVFPHSISDREQSSKRLESIEKRDPENTRQNHFPKGEFLALRRHEHECAYQL